MKQGQLIPSERVAAKTLIRKVLETLGSASTNDVWVAVRDQLPASLRLSLEARGANALIREALTETSEAGIPFAQPIGNEDGAWKQLLLFSYEELHALIVRRDRALVADYEATMKLVAYCQDRFGRAPMVTQLERRDDQAAG